MQWQWPEDDVVMYGRRYRSIKTGWGCFAKTRWVATDDYYRAPCTRANRSFFRLLIIVPVIYNPHIHYVLFEPGAPYHYGQGWDAPFPYPFPPGPGDWGYPPCVGGGPAGRRHEIDDMFANLGDHEVAEDYQGYDDWRHARHGENVARLDREMNEIADRPQGYVEELMRGWQDGGDGFEDNPERRRLRRLWREVRDLQQRRAQVEREDLERIRQEREERRLGRYFANRYHHGRRGGPGYYR